MSLSNLVLCMVICSIYMYIQSNCCVFWPDKESSTLVFDIVQVSHKDTLTGEDYDTVKMDVVDKRKVRRIPS